MFKIYVDRLKDGQTEKIEEMAPPDFLDVHESELNFLEPVSVSGEAYLADDHLVMHLKIKTDAQMPCSICNDKLKFLIDIPDFYLAEKLEELKSPIFDYSSELREAILVQVPAYAECCNGRCPERESIKKYLKNSQPEETPHSFPFSELDKT